MSEFTYDAYRYLISWLKARKVHVGAFRDITHQKRYVILRHDIDFSPAKALEMARIDHEAGCTATFLVLMTSPYYNALAEVSASILRSIASLGHEIGLHVDFSEYKALSVADQRKNVNHLAVCLADAVGQRVTAISQHKPARTGFRVECPGFVDAYAAPHFQDIGYISDSRRRFRQEEVIRFVEKHSRSQMLIHPIWWTASPMRRHEILKQLASDIARSARQDLADEERGIVAWLAKRSPMQPTMAERKAVTGEVGRHG